MADTTLTDPYKLFGAAPSVKAPSPTFPPKEEELTSPYQLFGVQPQQPPVQAEKPSTSLTVDDVVNDPERLGKIRKMMSTTKDIHYEKEDPRKTVEDFMSHMRWMNTNEVSTIAELFDVTSADAEKKAVYGDAYKVYNEMGSMFSNGDGWNGMLDYAGAVVTSPSTWLGLGIGKLAGTAATKAAAKKAMQTGLNAATKQIVVKSGGKAAAPMVKAELKNFAAKAAARYHLAGALAVEAPLGAIQDYWVQETMMETGVQDEYSKLQGAIATVAGGISAIPAIIALRRGNVSPLGETAELLKAGRATRQQKAAKAAAPKVQDSLSKAQVDWLKMVEAGRGFETNIPLQDAVRNWFFDINDENSLVRILHESGADLSFEDGEFTKGLIGYALNMGDEALADFNKAFEPLGLTFGESVLLANKTIDKPSGLGDAVDVIAGTVSRAGSVLSDPSVASRWFKEMQNISVAKKTSQKAIIDGLEEAADVPVDDKKYASYALSLWKKMLVSTYPTTALNVKGWAMARAATTMADLTLAAGLMGTAGINAVINPGSGLAVKNLAKVKALAQNQTFALSTLVDPFMSGRAFLDLLETAPSKIRKNVAGQIYGGIDNFKPERFGLNSNSTVVKGLEKTSDAAQTMSLVHLQDTLTKGITGLTALDRESRINFGKGITDLVADGEAWKLTDEMWEKTLNAVLRETFSEDLSKGKGVGAILAKVVQGLSDNPATGFIIPFGKFINNTVAFTYRHSPLALVSVMGRAFKGERDEELGQALARSVAGTAMMWYMADHEKQKQEDGLQWFERRTANGSVEDFTNMFPHSTYALIGRITHNFVRGEGMDMGLIDSLKQQIGPLEALQDLTDPKFITNLAKFLTDERIDDEEKNAVLEVVGGFGNFIAGTAGDILAGYTRPFDLASRMVSEANPEAGGGLTVDRKQAEGMDAFILGLTRYTNGFFNLVFGEENEYGVRMMGEPKQSAVSPGPVGIPNPGTTFVGQTIQPPARHLNKLLGMVDKPPFKADSFTSGNAEYDAFVNREITPLLERRAKELLDNPRFQSAPQSMKIEAVQQMVNETQADIRSMLEGGRIGGVNDRLVNERRKLLAQPRPARIRAMKALGITTKEKDLSLLEVEAIKRWMDAED